MVRASRVIRNLQMTDLATFSGAAGRARDLEDAAKFTGLRYDLL
jgi:hypothetical protein